MLLQRLPPRRAILRAALGLALAIPTRPARASIEGLFAPAKKLWSRWLAHDESSNLAIDHAPFGRFLRTYVAADATGISRVAYGKVTAADRKALGAYVDALAAAPVDHLPRREQLALWINLYNALTIDVVLGRYPVRSILDIDLSPGLFTRGPWDKALISIAGEPLTLNDIEHRILRPIWNDPRIHYAVNCASLGCPNLQPAAYTAATTEAMMEDGARGYVNHPRGARVENGRLVASKIYDWYQEDFGGSERGVLGHLRRYAAPELAAALAGVQGIERYQYDWSLNDVPQ
jgi:Protein of unknown function, DUF547